MNGTTTLTATFGTTLTEITANVASRNVNGTDGLRAIARSLSLNYKGRRKTDLVDSIARTILNTIKLEAAKAALKDEQKVARNDNHTINGNVAIVDSLWTLFTRDGGALVNDIHAVLTAAGVNVKRGTVVSRLATQRNNGMVSSHNGTDSKNRTITFFSATGAWDKATMARKFAKVQ